MKKNFQALMQPAPPQALFIFVVCMLLVSLILLRPPADHDMWWHLSSGRAMWQSGEILMQDIFSYTRAGQPWTNAFWLSDVLLYGAYQLGGFYAIALAVSGMGVLTLAVVYKHAKSPLPIRLGVVILAALAMSPVWSPRPQLVSFFLIALLDYFLSRKEESLHKPIWLLLPLFAFWPNFHGGFIFGFLLLAAFFAAKFLEPLLYSIADWRHRLKKIMQWLGISLLAALAVGLNPNGLAIWKLPFYTVDVSLAIQEWHSPNFHRLDLHPILWLLFLLVIGLGFSQKKISLFDLFKTLGFAYMTFYSQRSMALFAIVAAPVAARYLAAAWEDWKLAPVGLWLAHLQTSSANKPLAPKFIKTLNLLVVSFLLIFVLLRAFMFSLPSEIYRAYPKDAVTWINSNQPQAQMFNSYNWGGYLTWDLSAYPVFIDGRADLYGDEIIGQWWEIVRGTTDGLQRLDDWNVNFVLIEPDWPIVPALEQAGWQVLFRDPLSVVLGRNQ